MKSRQAEGQDRSASGQQRQWLDVSRKADARFMVESGWSAVVNGVYGWIELRHPSAHAAASLVHTLAPRAQRWGWVLMHMECVGNGWMGERA